MIKEKKGKNNSMRAMIIMGSDKQKESDNNGMENFLTRRETDSMLRVVPKFRQFLRSNFRFPRFKDPQIPMIERSRDSKIHRFPARK